MSSTLTKELRHLNPLVCLCLKHLGSANLILPADLG